MKFEKALKFTSTLVALSGLLALFLTREAADWLIVPAALLVAGSAALSASKLIILKGRTVTAATVVAFLLSILDFFYVSGSLILAGAHFLVILLCLKSLSLARGRDYIQLYGVSFFILLASTGLSTDIGFLWGFTAFFISLTWSLMLLTIKSEAERAGKTAAGWNAGRLFFISTALLTLVSTVFTLAIFLSIPRVGIGYFSRHAGGILKSAGFSDRVELGSMGEILLDPTTVMRVELSGARPPKELYWRGRAFDRYNGTSWEDSLNRRTMLERGLGPSFFLGLGKRPPKEPLVQRISLEPTDSATLFAISPAFEITIATRNLIVDQSRDIFLPAPAPGRIDYTVLSAPVEPSAQDLERLPPVMPQFSDMYLQLPEGPGDIISLAKKITAGEVNRYKKTSRIMSYLKDNYLYSLAPPRDKRFAPVEDFLFHSKSGYCGHFATSMVLLLRASGIPSRLVSGFMGGELNEMGQYYIVRERDAHTWVEVYFPEYGWITFDPTPASRSALSRPTAGFSKLIDLIKFKWDRYIVFYNLRDQLGTAKAVTSRLSKTRDDALEAFRRLSGFKPGRTQSRLPLAGIVILFALLSISAAVYFLAIRRVNHRRSAEVWFYKEMNGILARKGIKRPPSVTPAEFALSLSAEKEDLYKAVQYITGIYNMARFGGHEVGEDELSAIRKALSLLGRN